VTRNLFFPEFPSPLTRRRHKLLTDVQMMPAMPKREYFERTIQNITSKFPDVYAALFISPEGFTINSWGLTPERCEEVSALLGALIGKTKEVIGQMFKEGALQFIQVQTSLGGIRIAPQEELILVTLTHT
jgi:predicted regulator of Ras-like GTPase activity (Roadblock/LC7/MglB family)